MNHNRQCCDKAHSGQRRSFELRPLVNYGLWYFPVYPGAKTANAGNSIYFQHAAASEAFNHLAWQQNPQQRL